MKKNWICIALLAAAAVLAVVSAFLLPEVVAVQVGLDGQVSNTMPKAFAIFIPLGVSAAGSLMNLTGKRKNSSQGYLLSVVGIAILALSLIFNR